MWNTHENQCVKYVQSQQQRHKNDVSDVVPMSLSSVSEVCVLIIQSNICNMELLFAK